ncbi:hypothetical protein VWX97_15565 [Phaeobacter sp. JH18-32]|uniref:hypothetical protein n=1 Tax=Phaeobacter TaxID=302485 RepID=UPI003A8BEAEC
MNMQLLRGPCEQSVLKFIKSRDRFTYSEVAEHCPGTKSEREIFLRSLLRDGTVKPCGREKNVRFYRYDPPQANISGATGLETPAAFGPKCDEERQIWSFIHDRIYFTIEDLASVCAVGAIRTRFVSELRRHEIIREWGRSDGKIFYTTKTRQEAREHAKSMRATADGAIWITIRQQKKFRPIDIFAALSPARPDVSKDDILAYCRVLRAAGYLRPSARTRSREMQDDTLLILIRDTGPLPPQKKRMTVVVDSNEDKIVYAPGGRL